MTRALIVVDMQEDFVSGALAVAGALNLVRPILRRIREFDGPAAATADWHPEDHCSFIEQGGKWPPHCIRRTPGAQLVGGLLAEVSTVFFKGQDNLAESYSGFGGTNARGTSLDAWLSERDVTHVEIVGLAFDYCVGQTALDAMRREYVVEVPMGLTLPVAPESGYAMWQHLVEVGA